MMNRTSAAVAIFAAVSLAGCASDGSRYPSLAIRDAERAEGTFEPVEPARIDVPSVDIGAGGTAESRLGALVQAAESAHRDFMAATPAATRAASAARQSAVASDAWASAQVALANLDSIRSLTAVALGDLDILFVAASVEAAERRATEEARNRVLALITEQDSVLENLRAQVR